VLVGLSLWTGGTSCTSRDGQRKTETGVKSHVVR
jgi:hypothetical protein